MLDSEPSAGYGVTLSADTNLFGFLRALIKAGIDPRTREAEIWERYGQKVAVLVLDSSGFSRISRSHGIVHYLSKLLQMRDLVDPGFTAEGAIRSHFEADNAFAVFDNPNSAIRAARFCHEVVATAGLMLTEEEPFAVCIGIGYGQMLWSETLEGFFSAEMNIASKLGEDTANGGETLITEAAWAAADPELLVGSQRHQLNIAGLSTPYFQLP